MKTRLIFIHLTLLVLLNSCCFGTKENHLGNNIYLSEYDNVDRRILYQTESCTTSGVEIVPMTVLEISHNSDWIIAKSGSKKAEAEFKYWVIKNKYDQFPNSETVKNYTTEFNDFDLFKSFLIEKNIKLELNKID
jgi:hypothetical protein